MGILDKLFGKKSPQVEADLGPLNLNAQEETHVRTFRTRPASERMGTIMQLGDQGKAGHWGLMRYAILLDPDKDVTFAALKRIGNFPDKEAAIKLLKDLDQRSTGDSLEPYLSMAKVRVGLMTSEEFAVRINK